MLLISAVSTRSADCNGELCVAMQIYRPVCLAALAAEDEYTRLRRGETERGRGEMEMRHRKMGKGEQKEGSGEQSRKRQKDIDNRRNGDRLFLKTNRRCGY